MQTSTKIGPLTYSERCYEHKLIFQLSDRIAHFFFFGGGRLVFDSVAVHPKATIKTVTHPSPLVVHSVLGTMALQSMLSSHWGRRLLNEFIEKTRYEILQQFEAPPHIAKLIKEWLSEYTIEWIPDWPSNSPDLLPAENL